MYHNYRTNMSATGLGEIAVRQRVPWMGKKGLLQAASLCLPPAPEPAEQCSLSVAKSQAPNSPGHWIPVYIRFPFRQNPATILLLFFLTDFTSRSSSSPRSGYSDHIQLRQAKRI